MLKNIYAQQQVELLKVLSTLNVELKNISTGISKINSILKDSSGPVGIISQVLDSINFLSFLSSDPLKRRVQKSKAWKGNVSGNKSSKKVLDNIVTNLRTINSSNLYRFEKLISSNKDIFGETIPLSNLEDSNLISEFIGLDYKKTGNDSPSWFILNKIIPRLRDKFFAIENSFEKVGFVDENNFDSKKQNILELHYCINSFIAFVDGLQQTWSLSIPKTIRSRNVEVPTAGDKEDTSETSTSSSFNADNVMISSIDCDSKYFTRSAYSFKIDKQELTNLDTEQPHIYIKLSGVSKTVIGKSEENAELIFSNFIDKAYIRSAHRSLNLNKLIDKKYLIEKNNKIILVLVFNKSKLNDVISRMEDNEPFLNFNIPNKGDFYITAEDSSTLEFFKKFSQTATTQPFYKTTSPSGEVVTFTPADIVMGGGKLTDSKGRKFTPSTKRKGESLSKKVNAPGYGKVKK